MSIGTHHDPRRPTRAVRPERDDRNDILADTRLPQQDRGLTLASRFASRLARRPTGGAAEQRMRAGRFDSAASARGDADGAQNVDEFLATLAHELRSPLASLNNAAKLLEVLPHADPKVRDVARMISRQARHLTRLVADLDDATAIMTGETALERSRVDLRRIVSHALETCAPLMTARRHLLVQSGPEEPLWVDGDAVRLAQVFINLLTNAAKFTPPGGRIELRLERRDDEAAVTVADDGIGIDAAVLPRLFDRFVQAGASVDGGMGLGLPLVRRLVELHGGGVTAKSDGIARGSEFVVRLPLATT